jgi:hypothetical protein
MKTKSIIVSLLALLAGAFCQAEPLTSTFIAGPGESIVVSKVASDTPKAARDYFDLAEAKDVVRAFEILNDYAPYSLNEPERNTINAYVVTGSSTTMMLSGTNWTASPAPSTPADKLREEGRAKVREAEALEKKAADLKWARAVIAKWKKRVEDHE